MLGGDWLKKPSPKDYWDRSKITHRASIPLMHDVQRRVRCWDFAASTTGDWTVGVRGSLTKAGLIVPRASFVFAASRTKYIDVSVKPLPLIACSTRAASSGFPRIQGKAGKDQVRSFQNENAGIPIFARRPTGDKLTRFRPASARATTGTLEVVQGAWNGDLHDETEEIPLGTYDDQMDGVSDVVGVLTGAVVASYDAVSSYKPRLPQPRI